MIIVLEGANGTGKSTIAKKLSEALSVPIHRAFRDDESDHQDGERVMALRALGIPLNTFVEDAFIADMAGSTKQSVILDRSMPSGLAYAIQDKKMGVREAEALMEIWADSFRGETVLLAHFAASAEDRKARCQGRRFDEEQDEKVAWMIRHLCSSVRPRPDFVRVGVETSLYGEAEIFNYVLGNAKRLKEHADA